MEKEVLVTKGKEIFNNKYDYSLVGENFSIKEKLRKVSKKAHVLQSCDELLKIFFFFLF